MPSDSLVYTAALSLIAELADRRPVLCLIDDAHWLDRHRRKSLRFDDRRLDARGVVMLFAAREGDRRVFEALDLPSLELAACRPMQRPTLIGRDQDNPLKPSTSGWSSRPAVTRWR